jgi:valyl-tRNA synthetase
MEIPKIYDPKNVELKWQKLWEELGVYRFRREDEKTPTFVIDTPPPYPSGEFHMGTALNWTYIDIVARYKRMRGFNVLFPQGWDCHGLPTEVQVEKRYGIRKRDLPPEHFRELCVKLTEENIAHMKEEMRSLGFSQDWTTEYRTMDPGYYGRTQLSFVQLYKKGLIYRGEHPVNWCPRCETAIADAEVEYEDKEGVLNYIKFKVSGEDDHLTIATTRPEYLAACVVVAVHPEDERYKKYVGKKLEVPPFGQVVEIIEDHEVDPEFGTGVVMVCTYGDKTDVRWVKRHKLPVIKAVDEQGRMTEASGKYVGMGLEECKKKIIDDIRNARLLVKQENLTQSTGVCWRCHTSVEILAKDQWFLRVLDLNDKVVEGAKKVRWVPDYMLTRLIDWTESMDWDWVISRQRLFATPIPAWYCKGCSEPIVAEESQLPVNPAKDKPPVEQCPKCGRGEFEPERDVLDTWMDSSITIANHAGWPNLDRRLFPADIQPNGTDIIRTWDYYLLVRHLALLGEVPYKTVLINGMVFGEDGRKMSKSLGNYVDTMLARGKYGADALRQWAAVGASTGSDIPFAWKDVEFGYRFMRKFWNAARFAGLHIQGFKTEDVDLPELELRPSDRWILSRLNRVVKQATEYLEDFQFNQAITSIQTFIWHEFCDMYIEEVKHRLYGGDPTADAAKYALYQVILTAAKLLAPFLPHFAEEIYQTYFAADFPQPSIHVSGWPTADKLFIDEVAERIGDISNEVISAIRQFKSEHKMALSAELPAVEIYTTDSRAAKHLTQASEDITGTMRIGRLDVSVGRPKLAERVVALEADMAKLGPRLRSDAELVAQVLREADAEKLAKGLAKGSISVTVGEKEFKLASDEVRVIKETESAGHKVEAVNILEPPLTILITTP